MSLVCQGGFSLTEKEIENKFCKVTTIWQKNINLDCYGQKRMIAIKAIILFADWLLLMFLLWFPHYFGFVVSNGLFFTVILWLSGFIIFILNFLVVCFYTFGDFILL